MSVRAGSQRRLEFVDALEKVQHQPDRGVVQNASMDRLAVPNRRARA
jgi:hypothetical protein